MLIRIKMQKYEHMCKHITERENKHQMSNRRKVRGCAEKEDKKLMSAKFKGKAMNKGTWTTLNGEYTNKIDRILVDKECKVI